MSMIGQILAFGLDIYMWIVIAAVVVSWLIAFEVINPRHPQTENLLKLLNRATEPVFKPLRKYIPSLGGIDITPIIVIIVLSLLKGFVVRHMVYSMPYGI